MSIGIPDCELCIVPDKVPVDDFHQCALIKKYRLEDKRLKISYFFLNLPIVIHHKQHPNWYINNHVSIGLLSFFDQTQGT